MSLSVVKKLSLAILMVLSQLIAYVTLESDTECEGEQYIIMYEHHNTRCMMFSWLHSLTITVLVDEPWPGDVFALENSTVLFNCTTPSDSPLWSIDLASDGSNFQLQFSTGDEDLNNQGVYELPIINETGMPPTLRLLINDTAKNNGTKIFCDGGDESFETTLYVYGESHILFPTDTLYCLIYNND